MLILVAVVVIFSFVVAVGSALLISMKRAARLDNSAVVAMVFAHQTPVVRGRRHVV